MEAIDAINNIVSELNDILDSVIDGQYIQELLEYAQNRYSLRFIFVDFEFYNEVRRENARQRKIVGVKAQNFEFAASQRYLEKECQKYIELKAELNLEKSTFFCDEAYLVYCYLGTEKADKQLKERFLKLV